MKKVLFSAIALALLATSSCKKDDDNNDSSENFTVGSTSYPVVGGGSINSSSVIATSGDNSISSMSVIFNGSVPSANGTYKVVAYDGIPAANEVSFFTTVNNNSAIYHSTGSNIVNATVTVSGGKITVNMPKAWAKKVNSTDSVEVSANFTSD